MIGFSDEQLAALTAAASRIEHSKRNSFLRRVAGELAKLRRGSSVGIGLATLSLRSRSTRLSVGFRPIWPRESQLW